MVVNVNDSHSHEGISKRGTEQRNNDKMLNIEQL